MLSKLAIKILLTYGIERQHIHDQGLCLLIFLKTLNKSSEIMYYYLYRRSSSNDVVIKEN